MDTPMQRGDVGKVVLCSARDCHYNQNTKCVAEAVHVNLHQDHADCNTYTENHHPAGQMGQSRQMGEQY
jgi:hypothetical protein